MQSIPSPAPDGTTSQPAESAAHRDRGALKIVAVYILISGLWIVFSDQVSLLIAPDPAALLTIETIKGWGYVLAVALLLYVLIRRHTAQRLNTRTQSEAALRAAEEKYRSIFENVAEGIFQSTPAGRYLSVNPALARLYGYGSPDELIADIHDIATQTYVDPNRRAEFVQELTERGEIRGFENQVYRKDGSIIWIRANARVVRDETGAVRYYEGTVQDITDRKYAEEALRETGEFNQQIIASAQEGIIVTDRSLRCLVWNPFMEQISGWRAHEVLGKALSEFFPDWRAHRLDDLMEQALEGEMRSSRDLPYAFPAANRTGWTWYKMSPLYDARREIIGAIVMMYDITKRKRAEQFEHDQRLLAEALRNTAEAITGTLDLEEILDRILENVERVVPLDTVDLMLRHGEVFRIVRSRGYEQHSGAGFKAPPSFSIGDYANLAQIVDTRRPLMIEDIREYAGWVDIPHFEWARSYLGVPILINAEVVGLINLNAAQPNFYTPIHAARLQAFADQAAAALRNAQLLAETDRRAEELRASREQLRALSRHLQSIREEERTHIAREVHDDLGQALTGLKMDIVWLEKQLPADARRRNLRLKVRAMSALIDTTIQSVRRIATELRPGVLDDLGLVAAIEWQLQDFQRRTGIQCEVVSDGEDIQLEALRSTAVFRICQEALTNVARHAHATEVKIHLAAADDWLELAVQDNGQGIAADAIADPHSLGLLGMRERALLIGGEVNIVGQAGAGTTVTLRVPLGAA